jgi:hypothetical protein
MTNSQDVNPFDPSLLRLDQSFSDGAGVKKLLTTVPVRKPHRQEWVRVHDGEDQHLTPAAIIELKEDRETYVLRPEVARALGGEFSIVSIHLAINRHGVVFLWPVKLPSPDGRVLEWHRSAAEAAERAKGRWVKVVANMSLGAYEIHEAQAIFSDPIWPDLPFSEILKVAFRDRTINSLDHPVVKQLRGTV